MTTFALPVHKVIIVWWCGVLIKPRDVELLQVLAPEHSTNQSSGRYWHLNTQPIRAPAGTGT